MFRTVRAIAATAGVLAVAWAGAAAAAPTTVKFAIPTSPDSPTIRDLLAPWAQAAEEASDGALKIQTFAGFTVANFANVLDRTTNGVVDIGWAGTGYFPSQFPKTLVAALPFEARDAKEACGAFWSLYEKGLIADEYRRVKLLGFGDFPNVALHSRRPVAALADLQGLKVIALSRAVGESLQALGAVPVVLQYTEVYQALQRGTVEGVAGGFPTVLSLKLAEVTPHHLATPLGTEVMFLIMNNQSYERLPKEARAGLDRASGKAFVERAWPAFDSRDRETLAEVKNHPGNSVVVLSSDEERVWKAKVAGVVAEWARATPDGENVLAAFRREVARIRAGM